MIHIYYMISNNITNNDKLFNGDKYVCLGNFLEMFTQYQDHIVLICNGINEETRSVLETKFSELRNKIDVNLGGSPSFLYQLNLAVNTLPDEDVVYFIQDDYLHKIKSAECILQGLEYADYVSLYDNPDQYRSDDEGRETFRVILTKDSHWRYSNSITMTFASRVATLKKDYDLITKHLIGYDAPDGAGLWMELINAGRKLLTPLPGMSSIIEKNSISPFFLKDLPVNILEKLNSEIAPDEALQTDSGTPDKEESAGKIYFTFRTLRLNKENCKSVLNNLDYCFNDNFKVDEINNGNGAPMSGPTIRIKLHSSPSVVFDRVVTLITENKLLEAGEILLSEIDKDPINVTALNYLTQIQILLGKAELAGKIADAVLKISPDNAAALQYSKYLETLG